VWLGLADAMSSRAGVDRTLEIKRLSIEGLIDDAAGDLAGGVAAQQRAFDEAERMVGHDAPTLMALELALGGTQMRAGAWGKAATHLEHVLQLREASVGKDHPDVAIILSDLGACYLHIRQLDKARAAFERSLAIRESFYGKNSPLLVAVLDNYGEYLREAGDMPAALASMERSRKLAFIVPGPTNEMYHQLLTDYADTYVAAGQLAEARKMFDDAFALETQNKSPILPITQTSRAELALVERAWPEAIALATKAIAALEQTGGKDNPALWRPLTALAKAKLGQGHPADARPLLERAIAIGEKAQVDAAELAPARTALTTLPR
jgi:tetratricopeptide (TPR) repeat protein